MRRKKYGIIGLVVVAYFILRLPFLLYPRPYHELVETYAKHYEIDTAVVYSVMKVESKHNTQAISRSGAKGLMQIMDQTGAWGAQEIGIVAYENNMLFKPEVNIQIGCWYIAKLLRQYEGDLEVALAAYNAGSGHVAKWRSNPAYSQDGKHLHTIPFKETRLYVQKVKWHYTFYKWLYRS